MGMIQRRSGVYAVALMERVCATVTDRRYKISVLMDAPRRRSGVTKTACFLVERAAAVVGDPLHNAIIEQATATSKFPPRYPKRLRAICPNAE